MKRTHKLARTDHNDLSLRVARQMEHAGSPAIARAAIGGLHNDVVVIKSRSTMLTSARSNPSREPGDWRIPLAQRETGLRLQ
jgi:hypothetical protein